MLLGGIALTCPLGRAEAQSKEAEDLARAQFEQGQAEVENGNLKRARALFLASKERFPTAGTLLNLADCEEKLGLFASAWQHYRDAEEMLGANDSRRSFAKARLAAVEPRVPKLRIDLASRDVLGVRVLLDDRALPPSSLGVDLPLDPGRYTLTATAPGRRENSYGVHMVEGKRREISMGPGAPASQAAVAASATPAAAGPSSSELRTAGFIVGGLGLAGIAAAAFGAPLLQSGPLGASSSDSRRSPEIAAASLTGLVLGTALTWTGVGLVTYSSRRPTASVRVSLAPGGAGLSIGGLF